jgi:hypothetical protein
MTDLTSPTLIKAKGIMFLGIAVMSAYLLWADLPTFRTAALVCVLAWASSRFYYFLFYVLEKYVDPSLRYAGIGALIRTIWMRLKHDHVGV